jgi:histidyl-tRNA synthetase
MSTKVQAIRGTQDMLGEAAERFHAVVSAFDRVRRLYGFQRVEVPVFEATSVFARTLGETTDVVSKEMYTFEDRGGDSLTLRPEFTAGICRAYLTEGWQQYAPLKVSAWGPAFRYERPQKGRFRQFHQLDAEIIGADRPLADVELIGMGAQLLDELGIGQRVELKLNTLGDSETRNAWRAALVEHFTRHRFDLSNESRSRLEKNPLRILDSKEHKDFPTVDSAPVVDDYLSEEAAEFFSRVTDGLNSAGVKWTRDPRLVRGLDYYRHTAFEFVTEDLGAQSAVIAGGRYDGLIESMGGSSTPAIGWAGGIERLAMLTAPPEALRPTLAVVPDAPEAELEALAIAQALRRSGMSIEMSYSGNPKKRVERAKRAGVEAVLFVKPGTNSNEKLNLSHMSRDRVRAMDLLMDVLGRLPEPYRQLSGDDTET